MAIYQSKNKTKDGRSWFFRIKYTDVYGKKKDYTSPKYKLKREAENAEAKYRISLHMVKNVSTKTFNELFLEYEDRMSNELKKQTLNKHITQYNHIKPIIGELTVDKLTVAIYENLKSELKKKGFCVAYSNKVLGIIDCLIKYSKKFYGTSSDVPEICGKLKEVDHIKEEMQFFTLEEYKQFDSAISDHLWHTFFEFLYFMGTRQGEAIALNWNDVDFNKNEVKINKTLTTKIKGEKWTITSPKTKNSNRILPLPQKLLENLKTLKNEYMRYNKFNEDWFVFGGVRPLPETTILAKKNEYCKEAGVKQIRIHDFRHSCASLLINQGASIALVSKYLGHGNISITLNTYTHIFKNELQNMTDILNKL